MNMAIPKTSADQWAVLSAVVERGSYAKAAAVLHRSQPAVSYAIANLQASLGVTLLEIRGRRAVLTAHGETLLKRARAVLRDFATIEEFAQVLKRGWEPELRLVVDAAFPRARLLSIVQEVRATCPDTQIRLEDAVLSGAEEAIVDGTADVVVSTVVPPGVLGTWLMDVTSWRSRARGIHSPSSRQSAPPISKSTRSPSCAIPAGAVRVIRVGSRAPRAAR